MRERSIGGAVVLLGALAGSCLQQTGFCESNAMCDVGQICAGGSCVKLFPDCPIGYQRDDTAQGIMLCTKGGDEVVRVGTGGSAFWIDRYEASVWEHEDGTGWQYGKRGADYPPTFAINGQSSVPLFARSVSGTPPSASLSWFQAMEACAASGKKLPSGQEWLRAARGTPSDDSKSPCMLTAGSTRETNRHSLCQSVWGAKDMIGNVSEYTDEWFATLSTQDPSGNIANWGTAFGSDRNWNITSTVYHGGLPTPGLPAVALRGGSLAHSAMFPNNAGEGIFSLTLDRSPGDQATDHGFRCVVPR